MHQVLQLFRRLFFAIPVWFVASIGLALWLVDPRGPIRRDELPQIHWSRPAGEAPVWLTSGTEHNSAAEAIRAKLEERVTIEAKNSNLRQLLNEIEDRLKIRIVASRETLSDQFVSVSFVNVCAAEVLDKLLTPSHLTWQCDLPGVEIVHRSDAQHQSRCYDLSWALDGDQQADNVEMLVNDVFSQGGYVARIGSGLIVVASEPEHRRIARILADVAQIKPANLRRASSTNPGYRFNGCMF